MKAVMIVRAAAATFCALLSPALHAQSAVRPSIQDNFRLGTGGDALCRVQSRVVDPAIKGMFDRTYAIVCRDAAQPVGRIYALRASAAAAEQRLAALRPQGLRCTEGATVAALEDLAGTTMLQCQIGEGVAYRIYGVGRGKTAYVAEGLAGYDSAITLALRSIVADRVLPGEINIAATEAGDPAAFARVQAGSLDIAQALDEGYRRNNSGNYAEAAEFFEALLQRGETSDANLGEFLVNRALQRSNLGAFAEADALFARAEFVPTGDPVQLRLRRNFRALHLMNQQKFEEARKILAAPVAVSAGPVRAAVDTRPVIAPAVAETINSALPLTQLVGSQGNTLTPEERVAVLDAQALLLTGTISRLQKKPAEATEELTRAQTELLAIRDGRVTSIARLRAQGLSELSRIAEERGDLAEAERLLREATAVLTVEYPGSIAVAAANGRLAAFLGRHGRADDSIALYRDIVAQAGNGALSANVSPDMLAPYFALLAREIPRRPELVSDFFVAGETLVRPGVANTQAVLARELSAGDDEAARLFRQAITLTREVEQGRVLLARLRGLPAPTPEDQQKIASVARDLETLQASQAATQAKLSDFPRYRALANRSLTLEELRGTLREGEAYLKLLEVGGTVYTMLITPSGATAYRAGIGSKDLAKSVAALRGTVVTMENGAPVTYPFDLAAARKLYVQLFDPVSASLAGIHHVIFEPAGAMLTLPLNLLVMDDASLVTYAAAAKKDEFDFRGVKWLGRGRDISTAVSARAFTDVRSIAPSRARLEYLGLGHNAPAAPMLRLAAASTLDDCSWPLEAWSNPISADELFKARQIIGADRANVITSEGFSDLAIRQRPDLAQYRILHFATHGLVTAPRPECPARPALLTSFAMGPDGKPESDGLLTFREIFDLRFDADLVILSACDTAGAATAEATQDAGLAGGGDFALDGLVRAFVGAGGRSIVASHWPAPDDYQATERLIGGLFTGPAGTSIVGALRTAQESLMDDANTSHPYYWAGFAIVGDGTKPVLRPAQAATGTR